MTTGTTYAIDTLALTGSTGSATDTGISKPEDSAPVLTAIGALPGFGYWGGNRDWLIVGGWANASGTAQVCLDESNARTMVRAFEDAGCELNDCYAFENYGGAFGQGTHLTVKPNSNAHRIALELLARIADYPILDEMDWSEREHLAHLETLEDWAKCTYRNLDAFTLARCVDDAFANDGEYLDVDAWPNDKDARQRDLIASAIRATRRQVADEE